MPVLAFFQALKSDVDIQLDAVDLRKFVDRLIVPAATLSLADQLGAFGIHPREAVTVQVLFELFLEVPVHDDGLFFGEVQAQVIEPVGGEDHLDLVRETGVPEVSVGDRLVGIDLFLQEGNDHHAEQGLGIDLDGGAVPTVEVLFEVGFCRNGQ